MSPKHLLPTVLAAGILLMAAGMSAHSGGAPSPPPQLCIGASCSTAPATSAASNSVAAGIKWHPGHYAFSNAYTTLGNSTLPQKQAEIALVRAGPSQVLGIQETYFWRTLENGGAGVYDFSTIDKDYVQVTSGSTTWSPGSAFPGYKNPRRFGIYIMNEDYFSSGNPVTRNLPDYLLNSSSYGPVGPDGSHYGYWTISGSGGVGTGSSAALWRPAVMARVIALGRAMAAHVLPDGYTIDTSPYVEMIAMFGETSQQPSPATDSTYNAANMVTQMEALDVAMGPNGAGVAFPHTNVANFNNFLVGPNETQTLTNSFTASGTSAGGPDTFGLTSGTNICAGLCGRTWGQLAYVGYLSPGDSNYNNPWATRGGTNLQGVVPAIFQVQGTELGYLATYTPQDIFNQANSMKFTHLIWSIMSPGTLATTAINGNWWGSATAQLQWNSGSSTYGGVLYAITTNTLSQTACPSAYTRGCNTN